MVLYAYMNIYSVWVVNRCVTGQSVLVMDVCNNNVGFGITKGGRGIPFMKIIVVMFADNAVHA